MNFKDSLFLRIWIEQWTMDINIDSVLKKYAGQFGKYQKKRIALLAVILNLVQAHSLLSTVFIAAGIKLHEALWIK